jgi:16S rRNA (guanine1207-N2)-methyltransferase
MTLAMNEVLGAWFERVDVSHARQKSRVLRASGPRAEREPAAPGWPRGERHDDLGVTIVAHGGVFAGAGVDIGTRFLLGELGAAMPDAPTAVDLACGTGVVAAWLARERPGVRVVATDRSAAAAASARATAEANGVGDRVEVTQADGLERLAEASERLVVLNPPFHSDAALSTGIAAHLFADAARVLAPGGELWCVWNSHLRYRPMLERTVGPTRQIARNPKFTVTASRRDG